ncbi:family 10 glycosylhydrolase [Asanoa iriomotensis]|uniref:Glycosyl hydrolase n=1 Tax=Asanoa iriomotensis TaxID=234613 RepID=A0ABQ4C661_9ACTN|nr:glycosyl hydrolase [Asanoa iriomotensis]
MAVQRRLLIGLVVVALAVTVPAGATLLKRTSEAGRADAAGAPLPTCATDSLVAKRELRGMWLTTVSNIDFPSKPGLPEEKVKAEYLGWLDLAQKMNHNAVFVHVRPSGDAFWPSAYAPWSEWLTGVRGKDPGWDPLAWMVAETHARNLEFHAWFNPYRGSQPATSGGAGADFAKLAPDHPLRKHPEWAVAFPEGEANSRFYFDPGVPEARRHVEDAILDAVNRYDIDGVHFDDFFYPYPEGYEFNDDRSYARYGGGMSRGDWRRSNVDTFVREIGERIRAAKPWVRFGLSPFGIWRNKASDPAGSPTKGLESYEAIYADTRKWVRQKWLDYIVPQLYWNIGFDKADYAKLLPWWVATVKDTGVQLYIGQADYRIGEPGPWSQPAELDKQLALNDRYAVAGSIHFSAKQVRADRLGAVSRYRDAHYAQPALVPTITRLRDARPPAPGPIGSRRDGDRTVLTWRPVDDVTGYAVYQADPGAGNATLVATIRATDLPSWIGPVGSYCVTSLDRANNESAPVLVG